MDILISFELLKIFLILLVCSLLISTVILSASLLWVVVKQGSYYTKRNRMVFILLSITMALLSILLVIVLLWITGVIGIIITIPINGTSSMM